jgi:hypothetical protein
METNARQPLSWLRALLALAVVAAGLAGCGGSSSSDPAASADACGGAGCGTLLVGVTDADGDFVSYSVDVLSVTLERRNGASVEVLPGTTRIDFAQLTELSDQDSNKIDARILLLPVEQCFFCLIAFNHTGFVVGKFITKFQRFPG